jgi:hypothetical protein
MRDGSERCYAVLAWSVYHKHYIPEWVVEVEVVFIVIVATYHACSVSAPSLIGILRLVSVTQEPVNRIIPF